MCGCPGRDGEELARGIFCLCVPENLQEMEKLQQWLETPFLGNPAGSWLLALFTFAGIVLGEWVLRKVVVRRLRVLARKTETEWDDFLTGFLTRRINSIVAAGIGIYAGSFWLTVPELVDRLIYILFIASVTIYGALFVIALIDFLLMRRLLPAVEEKVSDIELRARRTLFRTISVIVKVLIWPLVVIIILDNLGYDVTGLLAGLGVGGLAIGLALQNVLQDVIASFSIQIDKPFVVGEFIKVGDKMGTVEHIGIKTTRIRSLTGEELSIPNRVLTDSIIHNYGRLEERRATFKIGIIYETPVEKVQKVPEILREAVESVELTRFDRAFFVAFGDFSLDFELVFWVRTSSYNEYLTRVQEVNLNIMRRFAEEGIEFAYPTQVIYVRGGE